MADEVRSVDAAAIDFPLLRSQHAWEHGPLPESLRHAQQDIGWAEHMVLFFPLWLGDIPALLKAFLEQVARPVSRSARANAMRSRAGAYLS